MAKIYIDPSATTNGSGTFASPFNTWNSVAWVNSNTYLQKEGTTFTGFLSHINVQANNATLSVYNAATGEELPVVFASNGKAKIIPDSGFPAIKINTGYTKATVRFFEITGAYNASGIMAGSVNNDPTILGRHTIEHCYIHHNNAASTIESSGITLFGIANTVRFNRVEYMSDDCIWLASKNARIYKNICIEPGLHVSRNTGDCIQLSGQGVGYKDIGDSVIASNYCFKQQYDEKQCIIIGDSADSVGPIWIVDNTCIRNTSDTTPNIGCYDSPTRLHIIGNRVTGGRYGINIFSGNSLIIGNTIKATNSNPIQIDNATTKSNVIIANNSISGVPGSGTGIWFPTSDATCKIYNNIITNCYGPLRCNYLTYENYNRAYGNTVNTVQYDGGAGAAGSGSNFNDSQINMNDDFTLSADSSCIDSGGYLYTFPVFDSDQEPIPVYKPCIGAVQLQR